MKSTEIMKERLKHVDMHNFFLKRIESAMNEKKYIEATWLIYSCFENRYFRTIEKIKDGCIYSKGRCNSKKNELALSTKVKCIQHLAESGCKCIYESFSNDIFSDTLNWIKERNIIVHNLLVLEQYQNMDIQFKEYAKKGIKILKKTYEYCMLMIKY